MKIPLPLQVVPDKGELRICLAHEGGEVRVVVEVIGKRRTMGKPAVVMLLMRRSRRCSVDLVIYKDFLP